MDKIDEAREVLRKAGYFVDNLWHINDVKDAYFVLDNEDAQEVLDDALTNEWIVEQIHLTISDIAISKGYKKI
jgi:hypothetical protein